MRTDLPMLAVATTGPGQDRDSEPRDLHNGWLPRIELLRPMCSWLVPDSFHKLEGCLLACNLAGLERSVLARLLRTKLADARIAAGGDLDNDVASTGRCLIYRTDGEEDQKGCLVMSRPARLPLPSIPAFDLLGVTLLGMRAGQSAPLMREDGTIGSVELLDVTPIRHCMAGVPIDHHG